MNANAQTKQKRDMGEGMLSPNHRPHAAHRRQNEKLLLALLVAMVVTAILLLIFGALRLILPLFKVQEVEITGMSYYTYEEILAASGIVEGEDEILALDGDKIATQILKECPYLKRCIVARGPFSVKITVVEHEGVMTSAVGDGMTVTFNRDFRVLEVIENGEAEDSPFLYVVLPPYQSMRRGEVIRFANPEIDLSYILRVCDALEKKGWFDEVHYADFSQRTAVSFVYRGRFLISLGNASELETKLTLAQETLRAQAAGGTDLDSVYAVIDVSNVQKTTWKICASYEDLF